MLAAQERTGFQPGAELGGKPGGAPVASGSLVIPVTRVTCHPVQEPP